MAKSVQIMVDSEQIELGDARIVEPQRVAASSSGMVATAHFSATEAGRQVLQQGGNAIDAAVAAAIALGVCEPAASGLGGQTMMLIHLAQPRRTFPLGGSPRAQNRTTQEFFAEKKTRLHGHAATTVPSTLAVCDYARRNYGTKPLDELLQPAIRLAEDGYPVSALQNKLTRRELKKLKAGTAGPLFLKEGARARPIGSQFKQPVLAETLRRIANCGSEDFYRGQIAQMIHDDMQTHGGLLHKDDLALVPEPVERRPVTCRFGSLRVITFPPPGAGRTLVEMLNILDQFSPEQRDPDTPAGAVLLAATIRQAFLDRRDRPFDPNLYQQVDEKRMLSTEYATEVAARLRKKLKPPKRIKTSGETTHLSVMDRHGNAVALTQSIERVYGSFAASPSLGFLYNNYMSAFEYEDIGHPYYLRPNGVPWASVAPTIVFRGRRPWLAIGSPGSERIAPSIVQVLLRLDRQSPYDAVAAPRLFCSINGEVSFEAARMRDDIPFALENHGMTVRPRDPYSFYLGCVQAVMYQDKTFIGVADPRRDGAAGGPKL